MGKEPTDNVGMDLAVVMSEAGPPGSGQVLLPSGCSGALGSGGQCQGQPAFVRADAEHRAGGDLSAWWGRGWIGLCPESSSWGDPLT